MEWTTEQVLAAAPDAQVAAAGKQLADAKHWKSAGRDDEAMWGECKGSALYQVRVALVDLGSKCSCPSRKFPCKHALGLLVLAAKSPKAVPTAERPEWVTSWISKREATATRKKAEKKPDAEAQAKRAASRNERVRGGLEALELWMGDIVRNGLASVETKAPAFWEQQAARLVDAQAPALASRIRAIANIPGATADWAERLLGELGRLALLARAFRRIDELPPAMQADVRAAIGWTTSEEEVRSGAPVSDRWVILGSINEDDERVRVQRTWLFGQTTRRDALVLQFAAGGANFSDVYLPGTVIDGDLAFWPSGYPQRALIAARRVAQTFVAAPAQTGMSVPQLLDAYANALAAQPWLWRIGVALGGVVPLVDTRGEWSVRDRDGHVLPLERGEHWRLGALSGGAPIGLTAEWDGYALTPLAAVIDGVFHRLTGVK